jgi:hypothetical protein
LGLTLPFSDYFNWAESMASKNEWQALNNGRLLSCIATYAVAIFNAADWIAPFDVKYRFQQKIFIVKIHFHH